MLGIPEVEVVVVHRARGEVFRSGSLEQSQQSVGIEILCLPLGNEVDVAVLGGVSVVLQVMFILRAALFIQPPRIPLALPGYGVSSPMQVNAKLGIAKPFRAFVLA